MEIQISKIYPPKQSGWSASIKAQDGNYYGVKEEVAKSLAEGQTITADVKMQEKNGKTYRDIIKIHDAGPSARPGSTPAPTQSTGRYGSNDDATAERIFVCGFVNATAPKVYEKFGAISSDQLTALVMVARTTWEETLGKKS